MSSFALLRVSVFSLALCFAFPAWCWPPTEEETKAWLKAIDEGDEAKLRQIIEQLSEGEVKNWINYRPDHSSLLAKAIMKGHLKIVQLFVERGADINGHHVDKETPLSLAVTLRLGDIVKYLLEQGADVEGRLPASRWSVSQSPSSTPLYWAASVGPVAMVELLLAYGADVQRVADFHRAMLQMTYPEDYSGGISAHFHQYQVRGKSFEVSMESSGEVPFPQWLSMQFASMVPMPLPSSVPDPLYNQAVLLTTLDLPDAIDFRNENSRRIVRIESYLLSTNFIAVSDPEKRAKAQHYRIIFTDDTGKKTAYQIKGKADEWQKGMAQSAVLGARIDRTFFYKNAHFELLDLNLSSSDDFPQYTPQKKYWPSADTEYAFVSTSSRDLGPNSDTNIAKFMKWHRGVIARLMIAALNDSPDLKQKALAAGCNVFCPGCGQGEDMFSCLEALKKVNIPASATGIDKNLEFIKTARKKWRYNRNMQFLQGDASHLVEIMTDRRTPLTGGINIFVAEDFLVHQVLPGAYVALQILHQLIQPQIADMVIIGGLHIPLVSERIALAAGWDVQQIEIYHSRAVSKYSSARSIEEVADGFEESRAVPAFVLKHQPEDLMMEKVYQWSLRRSAALDSTPGVLTTLDLSMSGLTVDALRHFLTHQQKLSVRVIDLSYSYIDEQQLSTVVNLLMGFPALEEVMASGFEPWYPALFKAIEAQQRLKLVARKDNDYRYELPSLDPETARLFGHYTSIPAMEIFPPESTQVSASQKPVTLQHEYASGYLSHELLTAYHQQMLEVLSLNDLQLYDTPSDDLCFFHAVAMQLGMATSDLQATLINHLLFNQATIETEFPAFSGGQFQTLIADLEGGLWGSAGLAPLLAWIFNKRIIVLYFNSSSGQVAVQVYNPDGSGSETLVTDSRSALPEGLNEKDIVLVHNGLGHWLAASNLHGDIDLMPHNLMLLNPSTTASQSSVLQQVEPQFESSNIPKLLATLVTAWNMKLKLSK